jgi:hypothetical protein
MGEGWRAEWGEESTHTSSGLLSGRGQAIVNVGFVPILKNLGKGTKVYFSAFIKWNTCECEKGIHV